MQNAATRTSEASLKAVQLATTRGIRPRVLCVEDERKIIAGYLRALEHRFELVEAPDGPTAMEIIATKGPFPVVVSDMCVPEMEGDEFVHCVSRRLPDTPHIVLVGPSDLERTMRAVVNGNVFRAMRKPLGADAVRRSSMTWRFDDSANEGFLEKLGKTLDGAVPQYRLVTADKHLLAAELEKHKDQLVHAERLATLGTLAGGVGHELNNITTVLVTILPFIKERAADGLPPEEEDILELDRLATHLKTHASQLLNLGRPGRVNDELLNVGDVVHNMVALLATTGRTKLVNIVTDIPLERATTVMDQTRLEQVLINLIGNACDALNEMTHRAREIRIRVQLPQPGEEYVSCSIADNGCGIPSSRLVQIFEPYFTTKAPESGTGLGLPVVKQIVESYGGDITVMSREGIGTTFTFRLPFCNHPVAIP